MGRGGVFGFFPSEILWNGLVAPSASPVLPAQWRSVGSGRDLGAMPSIRGDSALITGPSSLQSEHQAVSEPVQGRLPS